MDFDDILFERYLTALNSGSAAAKRAWRRLAPHGRGPVVVDIVGASGCTRRWLRLVDNRITVVSECVDHDHRGARVVIERERLFELSRAPWRYRADPALVRFQRVPIAGEEDET